MASDVKDRLSGGLNRERLKLELRRSLRPLAILLAGGGFSLVCLFVFLSNTAPFLYHSTTTLSVMTTDARGLLAGRSEVRVLGVKAGVVTGEQPVGGAVRLSLEVENSFLPMYRNAQVSIRPQTALEDVYVDIVNRGTPSAGRWQPAYVLPATQTTNAVNVVDILQDLQPDVRDRLAVVLRETGMGMSGRGLALRSALVQLTPFLNTVGEITQQLSERKLEVKRLIHNTGILTGYLGASDQQLRTLISQAATTLTTLQSGSPALNATLADLPPLVSELQQSFTAVGQAMPAVDGALVQLRPAVSKLPSGLAALKQLARVATPALTALHEPVARLTPLAAALNPLATNLNQAFAALLPQVPSINHVVTTTAACPVALQGFFQWTASTMKFGDARGIPIRGAATVGLGASGDVRDPNMVAGTSCAGGAPIGGTPTNIGDLATTGGLK
ncbi:MAG: MlaD family protein [Solirubrobacteraceae bacterium]